MIYRAMDGTYRMAPVSYGQLHGATLRRWPLRSRCCMDVLFRGESP